MKRKCRKQWRRWIRLFILPLLFFVGGINNTYAQSGIKITGKVIDASKMEVIGANIMVKGTTVGVITDLNGEYTITVPNEKSVLVFSFVGYRAQEQIVGKKRKIDILLEDDSQALDEVVVIAYGTQSKATLTGALSTIDSKELIKAPVASITNVLAGSLPGVSTVQTSGQPGSDAASIYVRGVGSLSSASSAPLVLVDGVERDFSQIDPNEIENLTILKDASSTAVFGVRGANGVVLVTTKRGKNGKPTINVSSLTGVQQPLSFVRQTGSYEFARFWNTKQQNDGAAKSTYFTREAIEAYRTGGDPLHPSIDWADYLYNDYFLQTKNNINISGGTDAVKYFVSIGYLYQNGILKQFNELPYNNNYKYNRYNYRANLDFQLTRTTTMKLNIGGNVGQQQEPNTTADIKNPFIYTQIWALPFSGLGVVNGTRTVVPASYTPVGGANVDGLRTYWGTGYKQKYVTTLNMDVDVTQKLDMLTKGLSVSIKGSYDNQFQLNKNRAGGNVESQFIYYKSTLDNSNLPQTDPDFDKTIVYVGRGDDDASTPLTYNEEYKRDRNWYIEGRLNYDRTFGDHKVSGLFLYNQSRNYYPLYADGTVASFQYMPRGYVGFVGRVTYGYKSRYLADVNMGYNGSENFAPGNTRYGLFPAASLGWVLSEESFMKSLRWLDYLKLRVSYGRVGSDTGTNTRFMYMPSTWTSSGDGYSFGVSNSVNSPAYVMGTPGNSEVSWETADKQNYGLELKVLDNRLSLSADLFYEKRTGILITPKSSPSIIATGLPNLNIGKVDNHGYELSLGWDETLKNNLRYYINANMSFARNKIIYMDEVPNEFDYMNQTGGSVGRSTNVYEFIRLYQNSDFTQDKDGNMKLNPNLPQPSVTVYPGDCMYADLNGDKVVDGNDRMTTGFAERPEYVFGLNAGFNYKGFNFSMQWSGATNVNKMLQIEYRIPFTNSGKRGLLEYFYQDCWTPENQLGAKYPRAAETSETWNSENSTLWLRDASYIRLKTISIGYTFSKKRFLKAIGANTLGLSLSGYNLLTFSPLDIMDPESLGNNDGAYPLVKIYSLGININF